MAIEIREREREREVGPNQTYNLLHNKENHKQNEKTTYRMGESICKWCNNKRLISKTYKQLILLNKKKNPKQPNWKMDGRPK